jgi:hypothetical protein
MNLAKLLEGPAVFFHRGQIFHSRGGAQLAPTAEAFALDTDAHGTIDQRALNNALALTLTPVGVWTQPQIDVLWRWQNARNGQLLTPRYDVLSIDTAEDEVTLLGDTSGELAYLNFPRKGCPVELATWGAAPAGLVADTLYYAGVPDAAAPNVITLHATEAAAIAGTDKINITDAGTGDHAFIEQEPLIIHTFENRRIVFPNAAVVSMPPILHSATQTMIGQVGFAAFRKNNAPWSAENSLYAVSKALLTDTPPDKANIPTQEYAAAWGAAPWAAFKFRDAATLTPTLTTSVVGNDARGDLGLKIQSVGATAVGQPEGFTEAQLLDILGMQGAGKARGASKIRANLVLTGSGVHNTIYNAAATALPQTFDVTSPRAGQIAFVSARTPGSPAFRIGTAAPV